MQLDRRSLFTGLAGASLLAAAAPAIAREAPQPPAEPSLTDGLAARLRENRQPIAFGPDGVSGPGWDSLLREASAAQFVALGEEHGIVQVPLLAGQLMTALRPAGFSRLSLETSPPATALLDQAARGGLAGLKAFCADGPPGPAFYNMAEEARMLAIVRAAYPGEAPVLMGLDYEVLQDRLLIDRLRAKAPPSARPALAALAGASAEAWAKWAQTHDPAFIFSFCGDPALVEAVQAAWPDPDAESADILRTLHASLVINQHQAAGRYFRSNDSRAAFNRDNFVRFWQAERRAGRAPKVMFKMGAGHMMRGRGMTEVYDVGSLISEAATLEGSHSFHLLVIPGPGGRQGALNPTNFTIDDVASDTLNELGLGFVAGALLETGSTYVDLRPLRPLMNASVTETADARLTRIIHGYDAMIVIKDARASRML
jgi:hypothetical protein